MIILLKTQVINLNKTSNNCYATVSVAKKTTNQKLVDPQMKALAKFPQLDSLFLSLLYRGGTTDAKQALLDEPWYFWRLFFDAEGNGSIKFPFIPFLGLSFEVQKDWLGSAVNWWKRKMDGIRSLICEVWYEVGEIVGEFCVLGVFVCPFWNCWILDLWLCISHRSKWYQPKVKVEDITRNSKFIHSYWLPGESGGFCELRCGKN